MVIELKGKKILFLIPTIRFGGAELFLLRLISKIHHEYDIVLVVIGEREGLFSEFERLGIRVIYLNYEKIFAFPLAVISFRRILKVEKPDVLHSFLYLADVLAGISSIMLSINVKVWSTRGTNLAKGTKKHKLLVQRFAAFLSDYLPDKIVACSSQVGDFHVGIGYPSNKISVIGNFLPEWTLDTESNSIFLTDSKPLVFSIGLAARYDIGKGHLALVECVTDFLKRHNHIQIVLKFAGKGCGDSGNLSDDLNLVSKIGDLRSKGNLKIETSGLLSGSDLSEWYRNLDLYFMASDSLEGFPNSLAEAVAIGLPAISTPVGSASDFLPSFRIAKDSTTLGMLEVLENFLSETLVGKVEISTQSQIRLLSEFSEFNVIGAYREIWKK
jgi:glycosyltransferase involved in cell wall biosynthesis